MASSDDICKLVMKGKTSWPELLGEKGKVAEETIEKENPYVDAQIVLEGTIVTQEYNCTRVRVWVNTDGCVTRVPTIGKNSWPELEGVKKGSSVPGHFRCDGLRVFIDDNHIITDVSTIG